MIQNWRQFAGRIMFRCVFERGCGEGV